MKICNITYELTNESIKGADFDDVYKFIIEKIDS